MTHPKITHSGPPVTDEALSALEARIGVLLPAEYRAFLLAHNGGVPEPAGFVFGPASEPYSDSLVDAFFIIGDEKLGLEDWIDLFRSRIPSDLLPIALDPFGNIIALGIDDPDRGAVFFWDHEEESSPPSRANVHRVADSFNAFLESLIEDDDDDDE